MWQFREKIPLPRERGATPSTNYVARRITCEFKEDLDEKREQCVKQIWWHLRLLLSRGMSVSKTGKADTILSLDLLILDSRFPPDFPDFRFSRFSTFSTFSRFFAFSTFPLFHFSTFPFFPDFSLFPLFYCFQILHSRFPDSHFY